MTLDQTRQTMEAYWAGGAEFIAEDASFTMMATGEETRGREAVLAMIQNFYSGIFDGHFEEKRSIIAEKHAVLEGTLIATHLKAFAGIPPSGEEVRIPMCVIYDVVEGQVQGARVYLETAVLQK